MLRDGLLLLYCAAIGFVAAGIAASFYKMVTHEPARFALLGPGWLAAFTTFLFCGLTGPAIILDLVIKMRFADRNAFGMFLGGIAIAILWSTCSGVVVLQFVLSLRGGLV